MAPKRAKSGKSADAKPKKKAKTDKAETPSVVSEEEPAPSPAGGGKLTVADAWVAPYVEKGVMTQTGFSELCSRIAVEEMSFEACYLMYLLIPSVEDVMTVCKSKADLQRTVEQLG